MKKIKNQKILAIIPARGGSKGLPGKNIKRLLGKPLIAWTIEQVKKSKYISKIIVSTDSQEIAKVAKHYGAKIPFLRPSEFAKDDSPMSDVVLHALNWFEKRREYFDIIVLLEPTSPLRKDDDIDNAIELFLRNFNKADSLVSIGAIHLENPYLMKKVENGIVKTFIESDENIYVRQHLSNVYFPYGVIYLSKVKPFKKYKTFYQERTIPYFIERWQNYEIEDLIDFICVASILKQRLKQ